MTDWISEINVARSYLRTVGRALDKDVAGEKKINRADYILLRCRLARLTADVEEAAQQGRNYYGTQDVEELARMTFERIKS